MRARLKERNPVLAGVIGFVVIVVALLVALNPDKLPLIGGGTTYSADFTEAAGLKPKDEVRIAGVKAGEVTAMSLEGTHVHVEFQVKDAWLGDRTTASIEIKTLLGQKYLTLDPEGDQPLDPDTTIPLQRTRAPFDINEAFNGLAATTGQIDTDQLAHSFEVMADTFRGSPPQVGQALQGLSSLSHTISSRDEQLAQLLANTRQVSQTISDRNSEFQKLISDGNLLLTELQSRKAAITALLQGTRNLAIQLRGVVTDNQAQLHPALAKLDQITALLDRNQAALSQGMQKMAPFVRVFANSVGNGEWFDGYVCGQTPPTLQVGPVTSNEQGCEPPIAGGGR